MSETGSDKKSITLSGKRDSPASLGTEDRFQGHTFLAQAPMDKVGANVINVPPGHSVGTGFSHDCLPVFSTPRRKPRRNPVYIRCLTITRPRSREGTLTGGNHFLTRQRPSVPDAQVPGSHVYGHLCAIQGSDRVPSTQVPQVSPDHLQGIDRSRTWWWVQMTSEQWTVNLELTKWVWAPDRRSHLIS